MLSFGYTRPLARVIEAFKEHRANKDPTLQCVGAPRTGGPRGRANSHRTPALLDAPRSGGSRASALVPNWARVAVVLRASRRPQVVLGRLLLPQAAAHPPARAHVAAERHQQALKLGADHEVPPHRPRLGACRRLPRLSLIHISEPTRRS
eukprot:1467326-Prymnesium_polylepis.1